MGHSFHQMLLQLNFCLLPLNFTSMHALRIKLPNHLQIACLPIVCLDRIHLLRMSPWTVRELTGFSEDSPRILGIIISLKYFHTKTNMQASEKEEYRNYLERNGVIDALTKVLERLYEESERPADALSFVKQHLGSLGGAEVEALKKEVQELMDANKELKAENDHLKEENESLKLQGAPK